MSVVYSDGCVDTHDELEAIFDGLEQDLSVVDLDVEFILQSVMDLDARPHVKVIHFIIPVGLVGDGDAIPSLWIDMSQSISRYLDDSLGQDVWLLLEMHMMLVWVIEVPHEAHTHDGIGHPDPVLHLLEAIAQHFIFYSIIISLLSN